MRKQWLAGLLGVSLGMAGCAQPGLNNQNIGTGIGGIIGGVAGSQVGKGTGRTAAIIAGTVIGAFVGGAVGRSMDSTDRMYANQALETAPTGQAVSWRNPDSGRQYSVTPVRTYQSQGAPCREYSTVAVIDGRQETVHGTACRQADGTWRAAN